MVEITENAPWKLFASSGFAGTIGGTGTVFGTTGFQDISVLDLAGTMTFDPSFGQGGDVVRLAGDGAAWQVSLAGANAHVSDGDTTVVLPVGSQGLALAFADGVRTLLYDPVAQQVRIGAQVLTAAPETLTAAGGAAEPPGETIASAEARLFLGQGSSATAGGRLQVFGTNASEQITIEHGRVVFDPSFARGGDTIALGGAAAAFEGRAAGSAFNLVGEDVDLTIPVGLTGSGLSFDDGARTLVYDETLGKTMFGAQTMLDTLHALEASSDSARDMVLFWNQVALDAITAAGTAPPVAARAMAMQGIAVHDAVAAIAGGGAYWVGLPVDGSSDVNAAVAYASHTVLKALFPGQAALIDARLAEALPGLGSGESREEGQDVGTAAAQAVLALRATDGSADVVAYVPGDEPGNWVPTPPGNAPSLLPQWPGVEPFAMQSASQFRAGPPPLLGSAEYAAALNEVKEIGSATSATRTADQSEIAVFWRDGAGTFTPPGHWNLIAQIAAEQTGASTAQNAKTFAILNVALADAAIACWDMKYEYEFWRPITAIRNANLDSNAATIADPAWTPLITTPPFPAYTSGHSTFSAAGATVLGSIFGEDFAFEVTSQELPGVIRSFDSFQDAALEAGMSRIYGGIHFSFDNEVGYEMGTQIGQWALGAFGAGAIA